jgi:hypothetical protein
MDREINPLTPGNISSPAAAAEEGEHAEATEQHGGIRLGDDGDGAGAVKTALVPG